MVLSGFNTEFKYKGQVYHVQTEDNGDQNPQVVTLLYLKGAILASKRTSYENLLEKKGYQKELMEIMKAQHQQIMREVLAGKFNRPPTPAAAPAPKTPDPESREKVVQPLTLDQAILQYLEAHAAGGEMKSGAASTQGRA